MSSLVSLEYALKLLKENPKIDEIVQGDVTIKKHWGCDVEDIGVYCVEGTKLKLDVLFNDLWMVIYVEGKEAN